MDEHQLQSELTQIAHYEREGMYSQLDMIAFAYPRRVQHFPIFTQPYVRTHSLDISYEEQPSRESKFQADLLDIILQGYTKHSETIYSKLRDLVIQDGKELHSFLYISFGRSLHHLYPDNALYELDDLGNQVLMAGKKHGREVFWSYANYPFNREPGIMGSHVRSPLLKTILSQLTENSAAPAK